MVKRQYPQKYHHARQNHTDQAFAQRSERGQRKHGPQPMAPSFAGWCTRTEQKAKQGAGNKHRHRHINGHNMRHGNIQPASGQHQGGQPATAPTIELARNDICHQRAKQRQKRSGYAHRPLVDTKGFDGSGLQPIKQCRFFKIDNAIQMRGNKIAGHQHFARNFRIAAFVGHHQRPRAQKHGISRCDEQGQ